MTLGSDRRQPEVPDSTAGHVVDRSRWGRAAALADQALSGLSNFLAVALIARSATAEDFGHFAVAYALFTALLVVGRRLWGTWISLTPTAADALHVAGGLAGAALWAAPVAAVALALPSLAVTGTPSWPVVAVLAAALPVVVAQDLSRYAAVAAGRPLVAVASDAVWVLVVAIGYAFRPSMPVALVIWVGGAVIALVVALVALRLRPSMRRGWAALRQRNATTEVHAAATVASSLSTYITLGLATLTLSAAAAGALRGASTVMAPVNTSFAFVGLALLPVAFRTPQAGHGRLVSRVSLGLVGLCVVWGGALLVVPDGVGQLVLGESWSGARAVLPWTIVEYVGLAISSGVGMGLLAIQQARLIGLVVMTHAVLAVVATAIAALVASSASTFALSLALASLVNAAAGSAIYSRHVRRTRTAGTV